MILTVGDSFTYGDELSNRDQAWPYLLGRPVLNQGHPGSSNDRIFRVAVEETARTRFDLVIVAWAFPNRKEVFQQRGANSGPRCINYNQTEELPWIQDYYRYSYDQDFAFRQWFVQILALQGYLKSQQQPYVFCNVTPLAQDYQKYMTYHDHVLNQIDPNHYVGWPLSGMLEWAKNTPCGPRGHFLEQGHKQVAEKINEHIGNFSWLS